MANIILQIMVCQSNGYGVWYSSYTPNVLSEVTRLVPWDTLNFISAQGDPKPPEYIKNHSNVKIMQWEDRLTNAENDIAVPIFKNYFPFTDNIINQVNQPDFHTYSWDLVFAKNVADSIGLDVYTIKVGRGGIPLVDPGGGVDSLDPAIVDEYADIIDEEIIKAKAAIALLGHTITNYIYLYDQGEADAASDDATYNAKWLTLHSRARASFGLALDSELPAFIREAHNQHSVLAAANSYVYNYPVSGIRSTENYRFSKVPIHNVGLTGIVDNLHIYLKGLNYIGEQIAANYLANVYVPQLLWDEQAILWKWLHSPIRTSSGEAGMYEETTLDTLVTNGSVVNGAKGMGLDMPSIPDLRSDPNNNAVTPWLFYYRDGGVGRYIEMGLDKFFEIVNGSGYRIQTDEEGGGGSLSPALALGSTHQITCQRAFPCALNETNAFWKHKNAAQEVMRYTNTTPIIESISVIEYFKPQLWEVIHYAAYGTITPASALAADFVTINSLVYTAVSGTKSDNTEFSIDGDDNDAALDLADSINNDVRAGTLNDLKAGFNSNVVTARQTVKGVAGNATTLTSSNGTRLAVSGATFANADDWEIWLNGALDNSGTGAVMADITEFWMGASGHPDGVHIYEGGFVDINIPSANITKIRNTAAILFPDSLPEFPCYDLLHISGSNQYLRDTDTGSPHTWSLFTDRQEGDFLKVLNFTGGNGIEGTPLYEWFFMDTADGRFPSSNKFDAHLNLHQGRVVITGGAGGGIDMITDDAVDIMSGAESFVDTIANLAIAVAANITAHTTPHAAVALGDEVVILYGTGTIISTATTMTTTDLSFTGDGNGKFLDRDHFLAGNGRGNPTLFGASSWVGSTTHVRQRVIPRDSEGNLGIPIEGLWMINNIQ